MKKYNIEKLNWKERFCYVKNIPFSADDLNCKGTKFQIVKFKPGVHLKPHYHKEICEIFYIQSGSGVLIMNCERFRCKADDFFLCEPGDVHGFLNDTTEDFIVLIFKTNEEESDIFWV